MGVPSTSHDRGKEKSHGNRQGLWEAEDQSTGGVGSQAVGPQDGWTEKVDWDKERQSQVGRSFRVSERGVVAT